MDNVPTSLEAENVYWAPSYSVWLIA